MFVDLASLGAGTWQAFERSVCRLLLCEGFEGVRLVGRSSDGGADVIGRKGGKRWLFQAKKWNRPVGMAVVEETTRALRTYQADIPVIVSMNGFEPPVLDAQAMLHSEGVPLQLWSGAKLAERAHALPDVSIAERSGSFVARPYQEAAIDDLTRQFLDGHSRKAMIVLATGLGKTFVAAEWIRRVRSSKPIRLLVLAHTNELVYQLERAFWPFLRPSQTTLVWNGYERQTIESLSNADVAFACVDSVHSWVSRGGAMPFFDIVIVDECHHAGSPTYASVLHALGTHPNGGPFLLGMTATPWRADEVELEPLFGTPSTVIDLVTGMRNGFLANVDYRMYTSNVDWNRLNQLGHSGLTPKAINRALFISEWDDGVVYALKEAWAEQPSPRALVFCGTIDHAIQMRDRVNALGFCKAAAVFSAGSAGQSMQPWERNRILSDFEDGRIGVVCAVDIFNEGIDVPDVNILVFQRVTHSRRIFIQQLGRGLRLAPGKDRVVVLDFVSDVRRFAAGLDLKDKIGVDDGATGKGRPMRVKLNNSVRFVRVGGEDPTAESFLRNWLDDVAAIEAAGEDSSVLKFPPQLSPSPQAPRDLADRAKD